MLKVKTILFSCVLFFAASHAQAAVYDFGQVATSHTGFFQTQQSAVYTDTNNRLSQNLSMISVASDIGEVAPSTQRYAGNSSNMLALLLAGFSLVTFMSYRRKKLF